ncbi:MAG: hypothetical protein ACRBF0_05190 [Calditrichia bacterium]
MVRTSYLSPLSTFVRKGLAICIPFFILLACSDRARDNPFDPGNTAPPPLSVELIPANDKIDLTWNITKPISDLQGFRLYRAVDSLAALAPFLDLPAAARSYSDTTISLNREYYYSLSILGTGVESNRSSVRISYTGLGKPLIFNRGGYSLERVSYDLRHPVETIESSFYQPKDWVLLPEEDLAWILFARFPSGISQLNLVDNTRQETILDTLSAPEDIAYNPNNSTVYILDQFVDRIYLFQNEKITSGIPLDIDAKYFKIEIDASDNRLYAIAQDRLNIINLGDLTQQRMFFFNNHEGLDIEKTGSGINVLTASVAEGTTRLYLYQGATVQDSLFVNGIFYRMTTDSLSENYFFAEALSSQDDVVVKLSMSGERQLQLPEGFLNIEQIVINPFDQSILVVDDQRDRVVLFDAAGNLISESRDNDGRSYLNVPLRVYIE